jgi:drug/metabolite transporter (DMT)-like permease
MDVVLGLLVALTYGTGDFLGGLSAKRTPATTVLVGSFLVSSGLLVAITLGWGVVGGLPPATTHDLTLGAACGVIGPVAIGLLYQGLATGRMSVVAPITAVVAAVVPFAWGVLRGERPSGIALGGVVLALLAVALISGAPAHPSEAARLDTIDEPGQTDGRADPGRSPSSPPGVVTGALLSGLGFGLVFVLLGSTSKHAGLWPLLSSRLVSLLATVAVLSIWARRHDRPLLPGNRSWVLVATSGVFDVGANGLYLAASHRGLLALVAVLSSLYPASTVVLARVVLGERLHQVQLIGLAVAVAGVVAITAG